MRFSERVGARKPRSVMQGRSLDRETRNLLWNAVERAVPPRGRTMTSGRRTWMELLYREIWSDFLKLPLDDMPSEPNVRQVFKSVITENAWYEAYDLLEFILAAKHAPKPEFERDVARVLEEELAGFRLLDGELVELTEEEEIEAVSAVLRDTDVPRFQPARIHIKAAVRLLSDRANPEYRNSMKEAISAVEAAVWRLTGTRR